MLHPPETGEKTQLASEVRLPNLARPATGDERFGMQVSEAHVWGVLSSLFLLL